MEWFDSLVHAQHDPVFAFKEFSQTIVGVYGVNRWFLSRRTRSSAFSHTSAVIVVGG